MVDGAPTPPATGGSSTGWARWRGPVLFVSLGLNLFLIGMMAGGWTHHPPFRSMLFAHGGPDHPGGPGPGPGAARGGGPSGLAFREAVHALPEADRAVFEESVSALRPELNKAQQDLRKTRQRLGDILRADQFDQAAFIDTLASVRQKQDTVLAMLHKSAAESIAKLSAESRKRFADALLTRPRPPAAP